MEHKGLLKAEYKMGYLFALPWLLGFLIFTLGPLLASIYLSLTSYDVLNPPNFIGLNNFRTLFHDPLFWKSLYNTFYMVIIGVPVNIIVAFSIALLLNVEIKGIAIYRAIYYLPSITPAVAASILWLWILNADFGILNSVLALLGIRGPNWLTDPAWAKLAIIMMGAWGAGGSMLIYLAGLKGIPVQLYEAAEIDGANWWYKFWRITVPMISPTLFFNLIMGVIGTFQIFTQAYIMTQGGPVDSTLFYVYYLFNNAFSYFKMGYACSMAWILFLIILALTALQLKLASYWVYYEAGQPPV